MARHGFSGLASKMVENTYGAPVGGIFVLAEEMLQLGSAGLFCMRYPQHPITRELCKVADLLARESS